MRKFLARFDLFINPVTWWLLGGLFACYVLAYAFPVLLKPAGVAGIILLIFAVADFLLLVLPKALLEAERQMTEKWSLSDENTVKIRIRNLTPLFWKLKIIDELPAELQVRDLELKSTLGPDSVAEVVYHVRPVKRGAYHFGAIRVFASSPIGFFSRRISSDAGQMAGVYPSIFQMRKYALHTISRIARYYGVKKMRRVGHSYEFEQIKEYVRGDDIRHLNWRATGRSMSLKTNHYTEEKSQPVYCIIDKSRVMNMAFDGLSLLDYAINSALVISNTALQKGDRAGLITFSDKIGTAIRADNSPGMLGKLLESLYQQKYRNTEADYEFLFNAVVRVANTRSLLFLFANFESLYALQRVLPVLRKINYKHLLVVIFFENSELSQFAYEASASVSEIYTRNIARQMVSDKQQMIHELNNHGIQSVLTRPQDLTLQTLNKYLELKSKGLI